MYQNSHMFMLHKRCHLTYWQHVKLVKVYRQLSQPTDAGGYPANCLLYDRWPGVHTVSKHGTSWCFNVHRNHKAYQGRGEGGGGMEVGRDGDYIPIATLSPLTRMSAALRWAAIRAILMFHSVIVRASHKTVSTDHNF